MGVNWSSNNVLPPGFGFHPTNEDLIKHYLLPKILGDDPNVDLFIHTIDDLCKLDPSELPSRCRKAWMNEYCYFFCKWNQYGKGKRYSRKTKTGYWKKTGKEIPIIDSVTGKQIGIRSIVVFYTAHNSSTKTDYIMHVYEYISHQSSSYVICRLQIQAKKTKNRKNRADTPCNIDNEPSGSDVRNLEIPVESSVIPQENVPIEWNPGWGSMAPDLFFIDGGEESVNASSNSSIPATLTDTAVVGDQARDGFDLVGSEPVFSPEDHHYREMQASCFAPEVSVREMIDELFCDPSSPLDGVFKDDGQPTATETFSVSDFAGFDEQLEFTSFAPEFLPRS